MKKFLVFTSVICGCFIGRSMAQSQKIVADKIIAKVGDKIILKSDIDNAISDYKRQGQDAQLPPDAECSFLEGQLIQKALVLQANRDSLSVADDELDALLDNQIRYFINMYGSQQALEEIAGKTVYQIKEDLRGPFKERKLADQMRSKILENVHVTPTEVTEYFNKIPKDSLPYYESKLEINQVVVYPTANKDVEDYVTAQLNDLKHQVETGQKRFDALAKIYSQDPGSKDNGGQYNVNRTDHSFDPTFMAAAFKLKEGQVSPVIKTRFGLHIIQMVSRAGDDAVIRHILIIPSVTDKEINTEKDKLDSVRSRVIKGYMTFGEAVNKYADEDAGKTSGGVVMGQDGSNFVTIDQLTDKDLVVLLKDMKPGDISKPQVYHDERGKTAVRIVFLRTRTDPHRANLKDDYNTISQRALEQKKMVVLQKWFKEHVPNYYIAIDKEYNNCTNISEWLHAEENASN
jgi:peptidyl-prolyl cis-trans isomerase SurA